MKKIFAILLSAAMLVAMFAVVASAAETNLALGKSYDAKGYTAGGEWPANYIANLTDGEYVTEVDFENQDQWFAFCTSEGNDGINAPDGVGTVTIDLEAVSNIAAIKVHAFNAEVAQGSGVKAPTAMVAYVDGVKLGSLTPASTEDQTATWWTLEAAAQGQKVTIEVTLDGIFAFINEIEVIEGEAPVEDESSEDASNEDASTDESSEDASTDESSDDASTDESEEDVEVPDVPEVDLGEENADAAFTMDITVPDGYKAGEEVVVTVTVNNVDATLQHVHGDLYFDTDVLGFTFDLKENKELKNVFEYAEWESFVKLATDENGDWYIAVDAATAGYENEDGDYVTTDVTEDGVLVFNITFVAKAEAEGDTVVYIPNASVVGDNVDTGAKYVGNGSQATIKVAVDEPVVDDSSDVVEDSSDVSVPTGEVSEDSSATEDTGDASSMILFAIIALVAIAGSAVVIKTRK